MPVRSRKSLRRGLRIEELEPRLVLDGQGLTVPLDPQLDQFGDQVLTVQAYGEEARLTFGIFDTGAAAITFSASDQEGLIAKNLGIPIKTQGGAVAEGLGGSIVGDISYPDAILADGLHTLKLNFDGSNVSYEAHFSFESAIAPGIQALVGSSASSDQLPTITGAPIMNPSNIFPNGLAALIDLQGLNLDLSSVAPGLSVHMPDLRFVSPNTQLTSTPDSTEPFTVPLSFIGSDTSSNPGDMLTESPNPIQPDVQAVAAGNTLLGQKFLFDTGAQMTVISSQMAAALGLDLENPTMTISAQGVSGPASIPGFTLDQLVLPSDQGPIVFQNVPVFVADVAPGLDGILGMNLFNTASRMLYNPNGASPSLSVTFQSTDPQHGPDLDTIAEDKLRELNLPFAGLLLHSGLPAFTMSSGQITGQVFQDNNINGQHDASEPGLAGQVVYIDVNNNGQLDQGETSVVTDIAGAYRFVGLTPGIYPVRLVVPPDLIPTSPTGPLADVQVVNGQDTTVHPFGGVRLSPDEINAFVSGVYGSILNRVPDTAGQAYWTAQLEGGTPRDDIAKAIWQSPEHRGQQVDQYYQTFLLRPSDTNGKRYWLNLFLNGATERDIQRGFVTSGEYQSSHVLNISYISGLYANILGRNADESGLAFWQQAFLRGATREEVANGFLTSTEAYRHGVEAYYVDLLGRQADETGEKYWVDQLQQHDDWNAIVAGFMGSQEYLSRQRLRLGGNG